MPFNSTSMNIFNVAVSAMTAQSQRMNVTASNMANAESVAGPDGMPYRAKQVVFQVAPSSYGAGDIGGVLDLRLQPLGSFGRVPNPARLVSTAKN